MLIRYLIFLFHEVSEIRYIFYMYGIPPFGIPNSHVTKTLKWHMAASKTEQEKPWWAKGPRGG